ncbi:MAG: HEAT repeat domain-containing protein [Saprospiraceae bacterium]|nr:HEAT repeat domain-containing protein [Saprospiraceae bacterium]
MEGNQLSYLRNQVFVFVLLGVISCNTGTPPPTQVKPPITLDAGEARILAEKIRSGVSAEVDSALNLTLWASDSLLADPVALDMDNYGRAFVTRTNRRRSSEFDIRNHKDWELASISFTDMEDRRAFLHKTLTPETCEKMGKPLDLNGDGVQDWHDLTVESEEAYRIEDKDADGLADFSQLVATGFNEEVTDVAGALLYTDDHLYLGVAPDLWRLTDKNGDGIMDEKESISHGFQVHIGFGGHNLSGLIMGPDGRLYWGIGDIGFHGIDKSGKEWSYPNEGVIVRCNPDGSDFEVFAHGLRNTHEFVFDQYGNIISVDNDGDHPGESERMVYVVNGSDAGWRINWQFGKYNDPENNDYKVWMDEAMYKPRFDGQAAYIVPCIRNYVNGPTGMLYNPGTILGSEWQDYFFVVEFNGNPARSGIHAFKLKPEGAGFAFDRDKKILSGVLATGLDAGSNGALYCTDWIDGWQKKGYGRIWKLDVKKPTWTNIRNETKELLASDFKTLTEENLKVLLEHQDMRVRQKAQFDLVRRKAESALSAVVESSTNQLARIHALWGLTQLIRQEVVGGEVITAYLQDSDPEVRAQTAKMLGDVRWKDAGARLVPLLNDQSPRVQFFAAEALGRIAYVPAVDAIIALLERNDDQDAYLRHAGSLALARIGNAESVIALKNNPSRALRIAAVITLRKLQNPALAEFLKDKDEFIVTEAARAINDDLSVDAALPALGELLNQTKFANEALIRRSISANLRVGTESSMQLLIDYAANAANPKVLRLEALAALGTWIKPSVVDRVDGRYRGSVERDPSLVRKIAGARLPALLGDRNADIRIEVLKTLAKLGVSGSIDDVAMVLKKDQDSKVRATALETMVALDPVRARQAIKKVLDKESPDVRIMALRLLKDAGVDPTEISDGLNTILTHGNSEEKQAALAALVNLPQEGIVDQLSLMLNELNNGHVDGALQLDLLEVAMENGNPEIQKQIAQYRENHADLGAVADYLECLEGGNAREGRRVLVNNSAAQCLKCHSLDGNGGVAGPPLDNVGARREASFILESLIIPSAHLAPGYGVVTVTLNNENLVSGILESEDDDTLVIKNSSEELITVKKSDIKERINALSSMPAMGDILSKREIRDVIAYLKTLKGEEL